MFILCLMLVKLKAYIIHTETSKGPRKKDLKEDEYQNISLKKHVKLKMATC